IRAGSRGGVQTGRFEFVSRRAGSGRRRAGRWGWIAAAIALAVLPRFAHAQPIKFTIVGAGQKQSAIAISQFKNLGGDDDGKVSGQFVHTVSRDLELSGFFRILDPNAYIEKAQESGFALGQFNFADWSSINAEFLVKGSVTAT